MGKLPERRTEAQVNFRKDLTLVLERVEQMLASKNLKYGDAALNPKQTFSKSSPIELLNVRMDDKLSRIENRQADEDEDPELDLLGYLILKQIALMREKLKFAEEAAQSLKAEQDRQNQFAGAA
jgi:hypothetical protein